MTDRRLIEVAFPLRQASIDSVHEKNVRHGHISTLHIWPARRPLAASRAALAAALLPDPGDDLARKALVERLGGRLVRNKDGKDETAGGILRWKNESSEDLAWFRNQIREAYGGRAPRVLDPFAGGGAIPLEAMRLGCEVVAADINPVAWFLLKCTLEYPQRLVGQVRRLPAFAWEDEEVREAWSKGPGKLKAPKGRGKPKGGGTQGALFAAQEAPEADLAWHVRAWGRWVLARARADLDRYYPLVDGKPTVAYLWARTAPCKKCSVIVPLLKTRWLCKKAGKRVRLTMAVIDDASARGGRRVEFGVEHDVPAPTGNAAQKKAKDRELGGGTMTRSGVTCPCCSGQMSMEDLRVRGRAQQLGAVMTAVVVAGQHGKEYRLPQEKDHEAVRAADGAVDAVFADVPFGLPTEETPKGGNGASRAFSIDGYGLDRWHKLFTRRQLVALGTFVKHTGSAKAAMEGLGYPAEWVEAMLGYGALAVDRIADAGSTVAHWQPGSEFNVSTFQRFALPISWDFSEVNALGGSTGSYAGAVDWIALVLDHVLAAGAPEPPRVLRRSVLDEIEAECVDVVVTDPPYYDAIPYSDLMDFFYVWLRRTLGDGLHPAGGEFENPLAPKWDSASRNGELIDDSSRFGGDAQASKRNYEDGMAGAFRSCHRALRPCGALVIVFAHKQPDAWETLVSAIIRAGFVVTGSWPIQTERQTRTRSIASAALSSSVWLVCRKRPTMARPGFDTTVLDEMRTNITASLRRFWDDGIRGPDFVWSATGPALEAYSKYPVVKKADQQGAVMAVGEFLAHARRLVVDFVVGEVFREVGGDANGASLDPVTTYWILHRRTFGVDDVPVGPVILYAISCGLSDRELLDVWDVLQIKGSAAAAGDDDEDGDGEEEDEDDGGKGAKVRLKAWDRRTRRGLGETAPAGKPVPVIDKVHRTLQLWKAGEVFDVDRFLARQGLERDATFRRVLQVAIELSQAGTEERGLLEALSNHVGIERVRRQAPLSLPGVETR